jgi:DNA-directed RNA polymerase subunit RPC12/RpoP
MQASPRVFTDDTVSTAILDVIREARQYVVLVLPYNDFWDHLKNDLIFAKQRGIRITAVYRAEERADDMKWLSGLGATIYAVDKLHAKLFLNETYLLMTSMNLLQSSSKNSREIAIRIEDGPASKEIRDYVDRRLIGLGRQFVAEMPGARQPVQGTTPAPPKKGTLDRAMDAIRTIKVSVSGGRCIRCGKAIDFDLERPFCADCFKTWNRYKDPDYPEIHCHRCGRDVETSFAKPLCRPCYQALK